VTKLSFRLAAVTVAVAMLVAAAPAAQARSLDHAARQACIERPTHDARSAKVRDDVGRTGPDDLTKLLRTDRSLQRAVAAPWEAVTIPVYFHVIRKDATAAGGNVTRAQIVEQIAVLNESFNGSTGGVWTGFRFTLNGVTRITSKQWFTLKGYGEEKAMKSTLKRGGPGTLNIYSANLGSRLLGWASLAQDAAAVGVFDGVVVHFRTLPGGDWGVYSHGDTGTHEVGHWINLYHTFQGGCEGPGDFVEDTAPEASPAFDCDPTRDTCVGGGPDPITNFMDYTADPCMFEFTRGQALRMRAAWLAYRD
jgi:hypothetical protein